MLVEFKNTWFGPSDEIQVDKIRCVSGCRYRKGVREVPDEFKDMLPKDAIIIEDVMVYPDPVIVQPDLKDFDETRAVSDAVANVNNEMNERLAKAREAKAKKAEARK